MIGISRPNSLLYLKPVSPPTPGGALIRMKKQQTTELQISENVTHLASETFCLFQWHLGPIRICHHFQSPCVKFYQSDYTQFDSRSKQKHFSAPSGQTCNQPQHSILMQCARGKISSPIPEVGTSYPCLWGSFRFQGRRNMPRTHFKKEW